MWCLRGGLPNNSIKINENSLQNRCPKTAAKITAAMSQTCPKWGSKGVNIGSKIALKVNRKTRSENGWFHGARWIPRDIQTAEPNSGAGISGPPSYPKSTGP